jgi:hypothetical protein
VIHLNLVRSVNFIVNFLLSQSNSARDSTSSPRRRSSGGGPLSSELRRLCVRLGPLRQVEETLINMLSGRSTFSSFDERSVVQQSYNPAKATEVSLRSGSGWRRGFAFGHKSDDSSGSSTQSDVMVGEDGQSRRILAALGDEIAALWKDPVVQKTLCAAEIGLQEQPGL